jgi:hypothetical protein
VISNTVGSPPRGPFPVGYTHNYTSCSVGYSASGTPSTTCLDQEEWSGVDYRCIGTGMSTTLMYSYRDYIYKGSKILHLKYMYDTEAFGVLNISIIFFYLNG